MREECGAPTRWGRRAAEWREGGKAGTCGVVHRRVAITLFRSKLITFPLARGDHSYKAYRSLYVVLTVTNYFNITFEAELQPG